MHPVQTAFDVDAIRKDFPILNRKVHGKPLVYLDNAATSQKPQVVLDALRDYYAGYNANIHRGLHSLADEATAAYEQTRSAVAQWIGASSPEEIVFTRGTTEGINLIAHAYGQSMLKPGDEVLVTALEHHSNIVPWQMACERSGAKLRVIPMHDDGSLNLDTLDTLLTERTKIVACIYISNALGTVNPVEELTIAAHKVGASILIDAAQATPHMAVDVQQLDCDYLVFSGHKVLGPTGIGILYGKKAMLEQLPPYQGGGEMISEVSFEKTTYNALPYKFEAGTPNIADTIALHTAILYMQQVGCEAIATHEHALLMHTNALLTEIKGVRLVGTAKEKASVVSFVAEGAHPQDIGILLDQEGIAIRTGHHCAQPIMQRLGLPGTCRASFAFYNTLEEVEVLAHALRKALKMLR